MPDTLPEVQHSPYGVAYLEMPLSDIRVGDVLLSWDVDRGGAWRVTLTETTRDYFGMGDDLVVLERVSENDGQWYSPLRDIATSVRRIRPRTNSLVTRYGMPERNAGEGSYDYLIRSIRAMQRNSATNRLISDHWTNTGGTGLSDNQRADAVFTRMMRDAGELPPEPATYDFGNGPVPAHRHGRRGGWVAETANVARTASVGPDARVYDGAVVGAYAVVRDSARVYGNAIVDDYALVQDRARVYGNARVMVEASVGGNAEIGGTCVVRSRGPYLTSGVHLSSPNFRVCTRCHVEYTEDAEHFSQSRGRWNAWCRECMRTYARERRAARTNNVPGNRRFGVEIEFHGNLERVAEELRNQGLGCEVEGYNHRVRNHWKVITDASVGRGGELVSPILRGADGMRQVRKACAALRAAGASVSRETGLHVHHDVAGLTVSAFKRLVANWSRSEHAIDMLVARSRRNGQWSRHLSSSELDTVNTSIDMQDAKNKCQYIDRYRSLNIHAYAVHGTVEVRSHQGTLNAEKIVSWVKFGQAFISAAVDGADMAFTEATELLPALTHLEQSVCDYLLERVRTLSANAGEDTESNRDADYDSACSGCGYYECECDDAYVDAA